MKREEQEKLCPFYEWEDPRPCEYGVAPYDANGDVVSVAECDGCEIFNCGGRITAPENIDRIEQDEAENLEKLNGRVTELLEQMKEIKRETVALERSLEGGQFSLMRRAEVEQAIESNREWVWKTENVLNGLKEYIEIGTPVKECNGVTN